MPNPTILLRLGLTHTFFQSENSKDAFHDALVAGRSAGGLYDLWRKVDCGRVRSCESENKVETRTEVPEGDGLQISCWKCRGFSNSGPCLEQLMNDRSKVIVISEHCCGSLNCIG